RNVGTILDFAVEGEERDELFDATCAEVIRTIEFARNNRHVPFSAFKITGVGRFDLLAKVSEKAQLSEEESKEYRRVYDRVESIFKRGYDLGVPILIDAEHTWIQPVLDDLVLEMMERYNKDV
ncbi:MAG TPA: proline dehydrogenase, partial [Porphyromonadaceae bacterium]|nr:proline dehydrogenase [Porphyromonadaceae bacterium]